MAINRNDETTQGQATAAGRSSQAFGGPSIDQAAPAAAAQSANRNVGIMEVNSFRRAAIGRFGVGESVESYRKAFEKCIEQQTSPEERNQFQLEVMNRETDKIFMSTLIVMRPVTYQGNPYAVVFALPVEASNPIEDRRSFQSGGQTSEMSWALSDVLDGPFFEQLSRFIATKLGESVKVVYAGGRGLPLELKSDDEQHIARILFEVDQALLTAAEQQITGTSPAAVSVAMFTADNARAQVSIDPTPTERDDSVGLPVRSGLNVQLRASKSVSLSQQNQSLNQREQDIILARVDAFVEAVYDTRHLAAPVQGWQGQRQNTQRFISRILITGLDSQVDALTPEISLLGIAALTACSQNPGNWANSLRPRHGASMSSDLQRMTNIGALGLAVPLDPNNPTDLRMVDTDPREFGDREFEALIEASFIQDPMYAILVPESGERSWLNEMFQFAATGDQAAYEQIVRTADNLTNGHFSALWKDRPNKQIVYNDQNRVHMGYFVDNSGKRVDLQHIDTLAMFNIFGEKDRQMVWDWIQTFNPTSNTLEQRIALREQIMRNTFSQVTVKGYGRTVTFYTDFLDALMQAIHNAGLSISPANTRLNDFQSKPQFGVYDPNLFTVSAARTGNAFTYGQLSTPQYRGIGGMMSGSFGRF